MREYSGQMKLKNTVLALMVVPAIFAASAAQAQPVTTLTTKQAAAAEESKFSFGITTLVDLKRDEKASSQYHDMTLGYQISPIVSVGLFGAFAGPLQETAKAKPNFWDPEIGLDLTLPINDESATTKFAFMTGTSFVIPTSVESSSKSMIAGWSVSGGLSVANPSFAITQKNAVYFYSYRFPDQASRGYQGIDSLDALFDENAAPAPEQPAPTYISSEHKLSLAWIFNKTFSWKNDATLYTDTAGEKATEQAGRLSSTIGVSWNKAIKTFGGVTTIRSFTKENEPAFFNEKNTALRLGMVIKI